MCKRSSIWLLLFLSYVYTQHPDCDFIQTVAANRTHYVYTPNYPVYVTKTHCRWIASCPDGFNCQLNCSEVIMAQSQGCVTDHLLVSRSGDPRFTDADRYCGEGSLLTASSGRNISIGLVTSHKSRLKCTLTAVSSESVCKCGCRTLIKNRIVGGEETAHEYPWMVALVERGGIQPRGGVLAGGGAILAPRRVLTCAHCVAGRRERELAVVPGVTVANAVTLDAFGYRIKKFIIHPKYSLSTYDYDIAIIETAKEIEFSEHVGPVCLPFKFENQDMTGKYLTVLGWGTVFPGGPISNVLLETSVQVISQEQCRAVTPYLTERQLCTYSPGRDSCQKDSGGPLLYWEGSRLYVLGVTSHGHSCASGRPAVNARLVPLLPWINNVGLQ